MATEVVLETESMDNDIQLFLKTNGLSFEWNTRASYQTGTKEQNFIDLQ
jgi:hypothetical protein